MIHIKNISFSYPDGNQALNQVSIGIEPGSSVAVVGANGAGKSTLLALLVGILTVEEGEIQIAGIPLIKNRLEEIRKKVGFVFQNPDDQLFMARVYDDVAFGPRNFGYNLDETKQMADHAIEIMKVGHLINRAPHKLSGGEKRNVAIATVLAMDPEVILFDEPSSFLDPKSRRNFINAMSELDHTKLIATHDLDLVLDLCERVIILKNGEVFADGNPIELFRDEELMEQAGLEVPLSLQNRA
ncbi:MAG: energy-coupling factor ABC transporter ATP-binding protein [Bacillota bacterium]